jgi:uncharacterized protein YutE (UPF0331/DUF86 family)
VTDAEIVLRKLAAVREHVARARRRRPATVEVLLADYDLQDALCMSLLVAIQESIDIAFHISADEGWGVPASNAEAFELLARNGVINAELARELGNAASLRNRIAHGYATVDLPRLWAEIPGGLDGLDRFIAKVAELLSKPAT